MKAKIWRSRIKEKTASPRRLRRNDER